MTSFALSTLTLSHGLDQTGLLVEVASVSPRGRARPGLHRAVRPYTPAGRCFVAALYPALCINPLSPHLLSA